MPVTTTPKAIIQMAYPKSTKNSPSKIATEAPELLGFVNRSLRGLYSLAARVNPVFFGAITPVAGSAGVWAMPPAAESIWFVRNATDGSEVAVVPASDPQAESGMAAIYFLGQSFYKATILAGTETLNFFYSKQPTDAATLTATLDSMWREEYNELLAYEVAIYLALKDGRADEVGVLKEERDRWLRLYVAALEHAVANERRRWGHFRAFNTNTLVPLSALVAGGSAALP